MRDEHRASRNRGSASTRWGLPIEDWRRAVAEAREAAEDAARAETTITYSQLCASIRVADFKPYSWRLMALLDEMCEEPDARFGIILATLVVRADSGRPGEGYFRALERLGADLSDREALWGVEARRVWRAYAAR